MFCIVLRNVVKCISGSFCSSSVTFDAILDAVTYNYIEVLHTESVVGGASSFQTVGRLKVYTIMCKLVKSIGVGQELR